VQWPQAIGGSYKTGWVEMPWGMQAVADLFLRGLPFSRGAKHVQTTGIGAIEPLEHQMTGEDCEM